MNKKLFNEDGTLTEEGKKTRKETKQRQTQRTAKKTYPKHSSRGSRGFNLYAEEDMMLEEGRERDSEKKSHPQTGDTTPEQAKDLLFEGAKQR